MSQIRRESVPKLIENHTIPQHAKSHPDTIFTVREAHWLAHCTSLHSLVAFKKHHYKNDATLNRQATTNDLQFAELFPKGVPK